MVCGLPTTQRHILSSVEPRHPKGTASGLSVEQLVIWIAFHFAEEFLAYQQLDCWQLAHLVPFLKSMIFGCFSEVFCIMLFNRDILLSKKKKKNSFKSDKYLHLNFSIFNLEIVQALWKFHGSWESLNEYLLSTSDEQALFQELEIEVQYTNKPNDAITVWYTIYLVINMDSLLCNIIDLFQNLKYSLLSSPGGDNEQDHSYSKCSISTHNNRPFLGHHREQSVKRFFYLHWGFNFLEWPLFQSQKSAFEPPTEMCSISVGEQGARLTFQPVFVKLEHTEKAGMSRGCSD